MTRKAGRPAIATPETVARAITALSNRGIEASVRTIREELGGGSHDVIVRVLRESKLPWGLPVEFCDAWYAVPIIEHPKLGWAVDFDKVWAFCPSDTVKPGSLWRKSGFSFLAKGVDWMLEQGPPITPERRVIVLASRIIEMTGDGRIYHPSNPLPPVQLHQYLTWAMQPQPASPEEAHHPGSRVDAASHGSKGVARLRDKRLTPTDPLGTLLPTTIVRRTTSE